MAKTDLQIERALRNLWRDAFLKLAEKVLKPEDVPEVIKMMGRAERELETQMRRER